MRQKRVESSDICVMSNRQLSPKAVSLTGQG